MSGAHTSFWPMVGAYVRHQGSSEAKICTPCVQLSPSPEYLTGIPVPVLKTHHVLPSWMIVGSCAPRAPVRGQLAAETGRASATKSSVAAASEIALPSESARGEGFEEQFQS